MRGLRTDTWPWRCAAWLMVLTVGSLLLAMSAGGTTWLVPDQYATIQAAIDASAPGDTVLLSPGTFSGEGNREIEFRGKDIVLTSRAGAEQTVIDCGGKRGFYLDEHESPAARIERLTIRNGWARHGDPGVSGAGGAIYPDPAIFLEF